MPDMSYSIGLCSQKGPFFTSYMKPIAPKYRFALRSHSTVEIFVTSAGSGALFKDPSTGMGSADVIGGPNCAEPNTYGKKEWSSRPQTPWDPAGSKEYVLIKRRTRSR